MSDSVFNQAPISGYIMLTILTCSTATRITKDKKFDAVLMMFAVLGYQLTNEDELAALNTVRKHLNPGGLFIFDVWYSPAVLAIRPSDRVKIIPTQDGKLIRVASGSLEINSQIAAVNYHILRISGDRLVSEIDETHKMRYFFPQELALFMSLYKLELVDSCAFADFHSPSKEDTWSVLVIGKAGL